ncbi:hypothetical protein CEW46_23950 [Bacillus cereus]|nr:hypothetical protein CEW46_23950 [Bacillus cereus]
MGSYLGTATFKDGTVKYFEYNSVVDQACPALHDTQDEAEDHWNNQPKVECYCEDTEPVTLNTNYGAGVTWKGKACRKHSAINYKTVDPESDEDWLNSPD